MHLLAETWVNLPPDAVFPFFADAANLQQLTPPWLHFGIRSPLPIDMRAGTRIEYRISLRGLPMSWLTEIAAYQPPEMFVDRQLRGPYRTWIHTHRFRSERGGTLLLDHVEFDMLGGIIVGPLVRRELRRIFTYRHEALLAHFKQPTPWAEANIRFESRPNRASAIVSSMTYTTLIDTSALADLLDASRVAVIDCRFDLANTSAGEAAYAHGHIPGAVYAHLDRDLSGLKTGSNGRHPLPSPAAAAATFARMGIDREVQVVAYDQDSGMYASRLWWMLRWLGHDAVAVLDGGFAKWTAEQRPTRAGVETRPPRPFEGSPRIAMTVSASDVPGLVESPAIRLVDARAPERFRGDVEAIDPVAGHIPGALNHFFGTNLVDGRFRSPEDLRSSFHESLGDASGEEIVCYCGSGVTACHNVLALAHAGLGMARLYPGSWSEWVADPTRGVERG